MAILLGETGSSMEAWEQVSCNNIYATRPGLEILNKGGNAFDAAVAVSLTLSVVEPHHSGIGGGCFSLLYDAENWENRRIDGRGIAPAKATADLFIKDGEVQDEWKDLGGQSVALPGLLKTMDIVLKKYGTMTLKDVAAPAIRCARNGFGTSYTGALTMYDNSVERKMRLSEAFRKLYLKEDGSFYRFGEIQKNQEIADLLENIAEQGVDYFYKGKVAKQIVDLINDRGGCFDVSDMESYEPKFREPVKTTYRGYEVAAFAPPSGGCALVEMLNILENYDVRSMGHNTAASIHALTESMKLGFADRSVALGDPDFVNVDVERLTSKKFAHERFTLAGEKAGEFASADGIEAKQYPGNTSHFVVMDKDGNAFRRHRRFETGLDVELLSMALGFVLITQCPISRRQ